MLTSKQRAEFRAQANTLETTLMVGKDGVTEAVAAEADRLLTARELVKGKVLESALMSAREVSDAICEATGAEGISCVGNKFVIWRFSEKCQEERNQTGGAQCHRPRQAEGNPQVQVRSCRKGHARPPCRSQEDPGAAQRILQGKGCGTCHRAQQRKAAERRRLR